VETVKPVLSSHTRKHKKWVLKADGCLTKVNISTHLTFGNILFGCLKPRSHCPSVSSGASRQLVAGGPGRTGTNREKFVSAFIHSRQCYGPDPVWGKTWARSVNVLLRFATVHSRCSPGGATVCPGVSRYATALPRAWAAEPWCQYGESRKKDCKAPVLLGSLWVSKELITDILFAKYRTQFTYQGKNRTAARVGEKIGNGEGKETLPPYPLLSLIQKWLRLIQITWVKLKQTWFKCFESWIGVHRLLPNSYLNYTVTLPAFTGC